MYLRVQITRDLEFKKEIRKNVTQALARLSMTSMLDVDQISSALSQVMVSKNNLFVVFFFANNMKKQGQLSLARTLLIQKFRFVGSYLSMLYE